MPAIAVAAVVGVLFFLGYRYYSTYLADRIYGLDPAFVTPAHQLNDGVDFVPTNKHVVFGHHFTSVAGAAPIHADDDVAFVREHGVPELIAAAETTGRVIRRKNGSASSVPARAAALLPVVCDAALLPPGQCQYGSLPL